MVSRENAEAKGRRYLGEGRLTVAAIGEHFVRATCRGGGQVYAVGWTRSRGWSCSCVARGTCSHLVALQLIVVVQAQGRR